MKKIRISAVTAGIIIATVAVAAQVIFGFSHPEAYGVCLVCHGRDMRHSYTRRYSIRP